MNHIANHMAGWAMNRPGRGVRGAGLLAGLLLLGACASDEVILEGERLGVRPSPIAASAQAAPDAAPDTAPDTAAPAPELNLPAPVSGPDWTQTAGGPTHAAPHPALAEVPQLVWSAAIGQGNSRRNRIASDPIVAEGRVYTLDSRARVAATSTSGQSLWARDLTPASDRANDASGGGLAYGDGRVFVTTGFGEIVALDPATGAPVWRQKLDAPATSSPTVAGGLVYVVSRDNRAWAIDASDGRVRWQLPGTPSLAGMVGGAGPAVTEQIAIFPFGSGELVAALRQGGVRVWGASVSGKRRGRAYANLTDIVADPVVVDGVIYTGNQSGRSVAIEAATGNRIWTVDEGAYGPVTVAGGSVFLISDEARLLRLDAATGERIWSVDLPYFKRERTRRSKAIYALYGPVLAGGNLWIASNDGSLKSYDPEDGSAGSSIDLPGGAASSMAVAGGTMYVLSDRGKLLAYR